MLQNNYKVANRLKIGDAHDGTSYVLKARSEKKHAINRTICVKKQVTFGKNSYTVNRSRGIKVSVYSIYSYRGALININCR